MTAASGIVPSRMPVRKALHTSAGEGTPRVSARAATTAHTTMSASDAGERRADLILASVFTRRPLSTSRIRSSWISETTRATSTSSRSRGRGALIRTSSSSLPGARRHDEHPVGEERGLPHVVRHEHERLASRRAPPTPAGPRPAGVRAPARPARRTARRPAARRVRTRGRERVPPAAACPADSSCGWASAKRSDRRSQPVHRAFASLVGGTRPQLQRELDVAGDRQPREQRRLLEQHRAVGAGAGDRRPSRSADPEVGASSPARMLRIVVLPQPDGPSRHTNSPSPTSNDTWSTAVTGAPSWTSASSRGRGPRASPVRRPVRPTSRRRSLIGAHRSRNFSAISICTTLPSWITRTTVPYLILRTMSATRQHRLLLGGEGLGPAAGSRGLGSFATKRSLGRAPDEAASTGPTTGDEEDRRAGT